MADYLQRVSAQRYHLQEIQVTKITTHRYWVLGGLYINEVSFVQLIYTHHSYPSIKPKLKCLFLVIFYIFITPRWSIWTETCTNPPYINNKNLYLCLMAALFIFVHVTTTMGRDSSVGIATAYRLDGPGIESQWGQDFPHPSRPALRPTQPPVQ